MSRDSNARTPRSMPLLAAAGIVFAALLALGTWQVQRLAWKEALIDRIESRIVSEPVEVERVMGDAGDDIDYLPLKATGRFEHEHEQYFFATHRGVSGWYVYTPLVLASGGRLFVNRGFVPYDARDPRTRIAGQISGEVTVSGLARAAPAEKPSFIVPANEPEKRIYYWKDLDAMSDAAGGGEFLPFFLDADASPVPGGLPAGGVTLVRLPNNHLQYAVTWYGLALALAVIVAVWLRGQARAPS